MSTYEKRRGAFGPQAAVVAALERIMHGHWKGKVEQYAVPQHLIDWRGNVRPEVAHVIVRRAHIGAYANDMGFLRLPDGTWEVINDVHAMGELCTQLDPQIAAIAKQLGKPAVEVWLDQLRGQAGFENAAMEAVRCGLQVRRVLDKQGRQQLQCMDPR